MSVVYLSDAERKLLLLALAAFAAQHTVHTDAALALYKYLTTGVRD